MTAIEFEKMMLTKERGHFDDFYRSISEKILPKEVDWRKKGCVSPVVNQGGWCKNVLQMK